MRGYILYRGDLKHDALIYIPPKLKFFDEENGRWRTAKGCGALFFARFNFDNDFWIKSPDDYLNLSKKTSKEVEKDLLRRTICLS